MSMEHIRIQIGHKNVNKTITPYLKIRMDSNGWSYHKKGYTVGGAGYYKLGRSLAKFFNEYLIDELEKATPEQMKKLIERGASDGEKWIMDNLRVEDLEILGARVEKSYYRNNDVYDIYFDDKQNMKGYKHKIQRRKPTCNFVCPEKMF